MYFDLFKKSSGDTDKELIETYKQSESLEILGDLYQRYMELVYGVCLNYLKEPEEAKDAVLNIFEELISKLKRHEVDNFKGWLYQLTKNHCLMKLRKQKVKHVSIGIGIESSFMQSGENSHLNDEINKEDNFKIMQFCLEQLVHEQRQVIELFYLKNKCYKEIVESTNIEINKVRSFIQNGRRNLKICMQKNSEEQLS